MENVYSQQEKVEICAGIAKQLRDYEGPQGKVNLFNESYSFVGPLKGIFKEYIHGNTFLKGSLEFVEINKKIDYHFPLTKNHNPLFVIRTGK
jgi:hypothetical protein